MGIFPSRNNSGRARGRCDTGINKSLENLGHGWSKNRDLFLKRGTQHTWVLPKPVIVWKMRDDIKREVQTQC